MSEWVRSGRGSTVLLIAILIVCTLHTFARGYIVHGRSMEPTIAHGTLLLAVAAPAPAVGDIVVLRESAEWGPEGGEGTLSVKRVVAVAGDHISCCERVSGLMTHNGELVVEEYVADEGQVSRTAFDVVVPAGTVWVLGDNREISWDSRASSGSHTRGAVRIEDVLGVVWYQLNLNAVLSQ